MPTVLITPEALREQPGPHVDLLRSAGFDVRYPRNPQFARGRDDQPATVAELAEIDATLASSEHYSRAVLSQLPRLRVIARTGVGYDRVDVGAATELGVVLTITPNSNHEAVAELTLALMLAVSKSIVINDQAVRAGQWPRKLLKPIRGKTLGLIGLGRIGRSTALRARALGMHVVAAENAPDNAFVAENQIRLVDLDTLLGVSDFVSLHCPLNDETKGMLDRRRFERMKPGAVLINTARGGLVNESDLIEGLRNGRPAAAGLDVQMQEPPDPANPLLAMDNVVFSPHLAGTDEVSLSAMAVEAAQALIELYQGRWPAAHIVNQQLQGRWRWDRGS